MDQLKPILEKPFNSRSLAQLASLSRENPSEKLTISHALFISLLRLGRFKLATEILPQKLETELALEKAYCLYRLNKDADSFIGILGNGIEDLYLKAQAVILLIFGKILNSFFIVV